MVFYGVVRPKFASKVPSLEEFRNIDPSVSINLMGLEQQPLFLLSPGLLVNLRVELIVPP